MKKLSRRTILAGLGASLALPALEAMSPMRQASASGAPVRVITFFIPNGVPLHHPSGSPDPKMWWPAEEGSGYAITPCLAPIEPYRERFNLLNGIVLGQPCADGHAGGTTGFATGLIPTINGAQGPSVDQVAAEHLGDDTPFRSLGVGVQKVDQAFNDFNIATFDELSWTAANQVAPLRRDPQQLFLDLFGNGLPSDSPEAQRRQEQRLSVLDFVKQDIAHLEKKLGRDDNLRLEAHLTAVRNLESRILNASAISCESPDAPGEGPWPSHVEKARVQVELLAMALRCGLTRHAAFMYGHGGNDGGGRDDAYGLSPVDGEWPQQHNFTHWLTERPQQYDALFQACTQFTLVQMGVFRHFLDKLTEGDDGFNDMLRDTIIYFGSELGDGVNHDNAGNVLPIILAGNAGGQLQTGRHLRYGSKKTVADLLFSVLQLAGANVSSFANSSNTIALS